LSEILRVAYKELLRRRRDPFALIVWILIPLSLAGMFSLIFGGVAGGGMPKATLLVADNDSSFVSNMLMSSLGSSQLENIIEPEGVEEAKGIDMMTEGKASALLVIPKGFGEAFLDGTQTSLRLIKNPMESILPSICESALETLIDMGSIARSLFDSPIQSLSDVAHTRGEPTLEDIDKTSLTIGHTIHKIQGYVFPPAVSLEVESLEKNEEEFNFAASYYPGLMLMAVLFISVGLSQDVWREKRHGALSRCIMTPISLFNFFTGKLIGGLAIVTVVIVIMLIAGPILFDLTWHHLWAVVLLALAVSALLLSAFSVMVLAMSRNERTSSVVTDILLMALMLTSGTTVPIEAMPASMVKMASLTPIGHVLLIDKELVKGNLPLGPVLVTAAAYLAVSAALGVIAGRGLFPKFANR
jgi:ABC-2 type transport system permease protein